MSLFLVGYWQECVLSNARIASAFAMKLKTVFFFLSQFSTVTLITITFIYFVKYIQSVQNRPLQNDKPVKIKTTQIKKNNAIKQLSTRLSHYLFSILNKLNPRYQGIEKILENISYAI